MSRAFFSDRSTTLPCSVNMDKDGKLTSIQHCHYQSIYDVQSVEDEILRIKTCIGFFEAYKADTKLDIAIRAEAAASVAQDEERLKQLKNRNSCNIL